MGEGNLGKLVVQITADLADLDKGLKDANSKVQSTSAKIEQSVKNISNGMLVVGGAVTGVFGLMVKSAVDYGDQIYEVSQRTGVAVETLSRLKYVAEQTESSFEAVTTGLRFLNKSLYEASQGQNEYKATFDSLKISVRDTNGNIKDAESVLMELADVFSKSSDEAAKTAMAMQIFGRSGASLIPILNLGSEGIKELSEEAERLGLVLSEKNAKDIDKFSDDMKSLKSAVGGVTLAIGISLMPVLTDFINKMKDAVARVKEWADKNPDLAKSITQVALATGTLALTLGTLGIAVINIGKGLASMWTWLNLIVPLATSLAVIRAFAWTDSILTISAAFGWWPATIAVIGAGLAGWGMEKLIEQIPGVSAFLDRLFGVAKENRPMRGGKVMSREEQAVFMSENGIGQEGQVDLGNIDINKASSEMDGVDPIAQIDKQKAAQQEYADWYSAMKQGLVAIDQNANMQEIAFAQQANEEKMSFLQMYNQMVQQSHQGVYAFLTSITQTFQQGLSSAITGIITGSMKAKDAFKELGEQMVQSIVSYLAQQAVAWAISKAISMVAHATATTMAVSLAAAWAPAAFLASVATLGGAVAAGSAALTAGMVQSIAMTAAATSAGSAGGSAGFAGGTDTVPAMLSPGELVMPRSFADAVRAGDLTLGGPGASSGGKTIEVNIQFSPNINTELDMELMTEKLGRVMEEKLRGV